MVYGRVEQKYHPQPFWVRHPDWPSERPWERGGGRWTKIEDPDPFEGYIKVSQGERAIDVTGHEVFVGDRIAVAVTISRSANMRVGKVVEIQEIMTDNWSYDYVDGKRVWPEGEGPKKGSGKFRIKCEWEASGWDNSVKASAVEAGLPKYVKL